MGSIVWGEAEGGKQGQGTEHGLSEERKAGRKHGLEPKEAVGAPAPQQDEKQTDTRGRGDSDLCESWYSGKLEADDRWQCVEGRMGSEKRRWRASSTGRGEKELWMEGGAKSREIYSQDTEILK